MNQIDYGPMLAASSQSPLTPAMQNMALMTALFRDVAMPMMQIGLQREQMALQQTNKLAEFELARANMGLEREKIQASKDLQLANVALEGKRFENQVQLKGMEFAHNAALVELADQKEMALLDKKRGYDLELFQKTQDLENTKMRLAAESEARKIAAENWQIEQASKVERAKISLDQVKEYVPAMEGAFRNGDYATFNRISAIVDPLRRGAMQDLGYPDLTPVSTVTEFQNRLSNPLEKAEIYKDDVHRARAYLALSNAPPAMQASQGFSRQMNELRAAAKTSPTSYFVGKPFPQVLPDGSGLKTTLDTDAKAPTTGTTLENAIRYSRGFPAEFAATKADALKREKNPDQLEKLKAWFHTVEQGTADYDTWNAESLGTTPDGAQSALAAPPGASEEAAAVKVSSNGYQPGFIRKAVGAAEKAVVKGYSHAIGGAKELFVGGAYQKELAKSDEWSARIDQELSAPFLRGNEIAEAKNAIGAAKAKYNSAANEIEQYANQKSMLFFDAIAAAMEGGTKSLKHAAEEIIVNTDWEKYSKQIPDETRLTMRFREAMARMEYYNSRLKQKD